MAAMNAERVLWYYDSRDEPSAPTQWTEYLDIDADIIEDAYQAGRESVDLDRYRVDLTNLVQVRLNDDTKRRSVKREVDSGSRYRIRPTRFMAAQAVQTLQESFTSNAFDAWCPFMQAWLDTPLGMRVLSDFQVCIEPCAQGIIQEAAHNPQHSNTHAAFIAGKLRLCSGKSRREVSQLCAMFYTRQTFLCEVLNQALGNCDLQKLNTVGPYAYLLSNHARTGKAYCSTVYQGAELDATHIDEYKNALGMWRPWPTFSSTSKHRSLAESLGNTLLVIEIIAGLPTTPRGFDVSELSKFSDEGEVVIPPGFNHQVMSVDQDPTQKYIIHLRI